MLVVVACCRRVWEVPEGTPSGICVFVFIHRSEALRTGVGSVYVSLPAFCVLKVLVMSQNHVRLVRKLGVWVRMAVVLVQTSAVCWENAAVLTQTVRTRVEFVRCMVRVTRFQTQSQWAGRSG